MSILSKNKLSLPTAIGLGTTVLGAAGNLLGQLLGTGTRGAQTEQNRATTSIRTYGVLRDNLFATSISLPNYLTAAQRSVKGVVVSDDLMLYAQAVNLPGVNIATGETRRYGFGPGIRYARDVSFNDVAVTFIGDGAGAILKIFTDWMNGIVKFDEYLSPSNSLSDPPFFFRYKKDYVAKKFFITVFNESRDEVAVYYLEDAFPTSISDINLNWGSTNQLASFTVNFTYTRWTHRSAVEDITEKLQVPGQGDASILSMLFQAGTAATMLTSLRRPRSVGDVINATSTAAFILGRFGR